MGRMMRSCPNLDLGNSCHVTAVHYYEPEVK